ncbi:MAG: glycosyltransferase family 39 protein [Phycisphaerae bacterium]|jgi:hypothetical protein
MLDIPLERDEGEYAYAGQLMLEGVPPYSLAYNMKMPGIYAVYAVILAVFGQSASGIHLAVLFINAATIILLFFMTKKLFGPIAGVGAAVFFAITSVSRTLNASANAENFVVLPAIAGIMLLINFINTKKYLFLITAGILSGIAFLMKQHGAGFILFSYSILFWDQVHQKPMNYKRLSSVILIYSFFTILPFLITCLILWYCGVFEKFWFWTFEYSRQYISITSFHEGFANLKEALRQIVSSAPFVWLFALLGISSIIWNRNIRKYGMFLISFLIYSFLMVCPGLYFRNHYFVLFLPVLSILAGAGVVAIQDFAGKRIKSASKAAFISILIIPAVWFESFYSQRSYLLESDAFVLSRANFGLNPFPEAQKIAEFIKANSNKDDRIAVLGSEPEIFFYSHRRSATPYIYVYPLVEPHPYAVDMQREMINQIEATKPRFVVFVKFHYSWLFRPESGKLILDWADNYVSTHYRQIGLVEIAVQGQTLYHWNSVAKSSKGDYLIFIGERID